MLDQELRDPLRFNKAAARMFGCDASQLLGKSFSLLVAAGINEKQRLALHDALHPSAERSGHRSCDFQGCAPGGTRNGLAVANALH